MWHSDERLLGIGVVLLVLTIGCEPPPKTNTPGIPNAAAPAADSAVATGANPAPATTPAIAPMPNSGTDSPSSTAPSAEVAKLTSLGCMPYYRAPGKPPIQNDEVRQIGFQYGKFMPNPEMPLLLSFPNLETLSLNFHPDLSDEAMATVAKIPKLKSLSLINSRHTANGLAALMEAKALEELNLTRTGVTDAEVATLSNMKNLKTLILGDSYMSSEAADQIRQNLPECKVEWSPHRKRPG
jgi:hypothetical protein